MFNCFENNNQRNSIRKKKLVIAQQRAGEVGLDGAVVGGNAKNLTESWEEVR